MLRGDCSYQRRQDETLPEKDVAQKTQEIRFQKLRHGVPSNPPLYIRYFFPILVTIGIIGGIAAFWIPVETGWLRQSGLSGEAEQKSISDLRLHLLYITGGTISVLLLLKIAKEYHFLKRFITYANWGKNWLYIILLLIVLFGGGSAYVIPLIISTPFKDGDTVPALRQAILVTIAGLLTMLTLWENRRKNLQEKDKNDLDHARQVQAERRSRYAKAIEQLADEKGTIRIGGVYTLTKLVDEWLSDEKTVPDTQKRQEEGQVIINSLCSYIRSSFPIAEKREYIDFLDKKNMYSQYSKEDVVLLREEQEVRRTILEEMSKRLKNKTSSILQNGDWSIFKYSFIKAPFFYPTNDLIFKDSDFSNSKFYGGGDFSGTKFIGEINFQGAHFEGDANFYKSFFKGNTDFTDAIFDEKTIFHSAIFNKFPNFLRVLFVDSPNFTNATFTEPTDFTGATFKNATFTEAKFKERADFFGSKFEGLTKFNGAVFSKNAIFSDAEFYGEADFQDAKFKNNALFRGAKFRYRLNFHKSIFSKSADFFTALFTESIEKEVTLSHRNRRVDLIGFSRTTFNGITNFSGSIFRGGLSFEESNFIDTPLFTSKIAGITYVSKFLYNGDPGKYIFYPRLGNISIDTDEIYYKGKKFIIPKGCAIFNPADSSTSAIFAKTQTP